MRISISLVVLAAACVGLVAGCAGPEQKLGRGLSNATALVGGGDVRRSMEQTALWDGPSAAYTTGFIRGMSRGVARTGIGFYEVLTFPFPSYGPLLNSTNRLYPDHSVKTRRYPYGGLVLPAGAVHPDNYKPGPLADSLFSTDSSLGFSGGEVAPFIPGSRFKIFDN